MMETSKENSNEKETIAMKDTDDNDASEEEITCPLFMTGLPKDFASNPGLSAIASLLEEDEEEQRVRHPIVRNTNVPKKTSSIRIGGGKARRTKRVHRTSPYPKRNTATKPSIGEAQLFLKMWKI